MESSIPNLDHMWPPERERARATFEALALYCRYAEEARIARITGMVARAKELEFQMDEVYGALPDWARW